MIQRGNRAGFALETLLRFRIGREVLRQYFDRDGALQSRIAGTVNLTHPSRTQRRLYLVGSEFGTRGEGHNARIIAPLWARFLPSHSGARRVRSLMALQPSSVVCCDLGFARGGSIVQY